MATNLVTGDGRARLLADGNEMPMLGLGVWQVPNGAACVNAVRRALELGYRHIDPTRPKPSRASSGSASSTSICTSSTGRKVVRSMPGQAWNGRDRHVNSTSASKRTRGAGA